MRALTMDEVESVSGGREMRPGDGVFLSANWQNSVADSFWMMSAYSGLSQQMNDYQAVKEPAAFNTGAQPLIDMGLAPVKVTAQRVGAAEVAGIGLAEVVVTSRRDWCGNDQFNVPDRIPGVMDFSEPCKFHDGDYDNALYVQKELADQRFLANMIISCSESSSFKTMPLCVTLAYLYYAGVALGGGHSYKQGLQGK